MLEFDAGFDPDKALQDVREKVDTARTNIPSETDEPSVNEINVSLFLVLSIGLSRPLSQRELITVARRLQDAIEGIPGAFLAGILLIWSLGYILNIVVLLSLILVAGILVDWTIVVSGLADRNLHNAIAGGLGFATLLTPALLVLGDKVAGKLRGLKANHAT